MKKYTVTYLMFLAALLLLAGCTMPVKQAALSQPNVPMAWIDAPLDGSHLPLGAVEIVTHASSPDQVTAVRVLVDQQTLDEKAPDEVNNGLALANFVWQAATPGEHLLQAQAQGADGSWGPLRDAVITIGDTTPEPTDSSQPADTPTPTPTATPTMTPTPTATVETACTNLAGFVSETVPDDTQFSPGDNFTKTWTLENRGTCTWDTGYALVFVDGRRMHGTSPEPLPHAVAPGQQITLSVDMQAPNNPDTYQGNWMLQDRDGNLFGLGGDGQTAFWVKIDVKISIIILPGIIDTQPPSVSVDYSPKGSGSPTESQQITFTANASDNVGVSQIKIYFSPAGAGSPTLVGSCSSTTVCTVKGGPYTNGSYVLYAEAFDAAGNHTSTATQNVSVQVVIK